MSDSAWKKQSHFTDPVHGDEVPKVDDAVAVGEDLEFQERWWTFEKVVWSVFVLILVADALGIFGAGWLAHAEIREAGVGMSIRYDRIQRTGTPNMLTVLFGEDVAHDSHVQLLVSDSLVKAFGAERVVPQPAMSTITAGGILYTLPVKDSPSEVDFELQPHAPGFYHFAFSVPGHRAVARHVLVLP